MNKVQAFIIEKRNFCYWVAMVIALMVFANIELLSMIIPIWATYLINAVLIIVTTVYARLLINNLKERIKEKKTEDESKLYAFLEQSFKNTDAAVHNVDENVTNSAELIKNELYSSKEMILKDIEAKKNDISEELASVQKHEDEAHELLKNRIEQFEAANKEHLENNTTKVLNSVKVAETCLSERLVKQTDEKATDINKNIEEVRNTLNESVTKLLEVTDASLQAVQKENIDNIANQTKALIEKLSTIDEANQVKTKEYQEIVEGKLASTDERLITEFANIGTSIVNQTGELIAKLDSVIEGNKSGSKANLEELQKTRDIIVDKLTDVDEANQVKEREYYNSVEERIHAKATEILSSSGDLANKLQMVSKALEGMEQRTVSAIAESSASVSQEVKDGVIQSANHINDVSERVIEVVKKNENDTAEKLDHQSQEILSAISGNSSELKKVGDELSKIEGMQSDNVVQIIELVGSKLLELNQELVKQANSILDKSDENTDYVSEKYNRVFEQIQSVAKESKILINRVNDAIEENKNTIIQSRNAVTDSIGSHFQDVKNKEKELESLKAVVERNFLNISSELKITRGQLSSLNSLSVLIKNLSENKKREDKVEKKQNQIETIEDPDSGLTVKNEYKQDKLITSQMFRGSKKVYDVFYGNRGEIVSTKNYDESGKVSLEMTYHPNGQVKERIEYISGKAELSSFDTNGNKIK